MYEELKSKHLIYKNSKNGSLTTSKDVVESIVCPIYFSEDKYVEIIIEKR